MSDRESAAARHMLHELREAAVEHGRALAAEELVPSPTTRHRVVATRLELERRTTAALDACGEKPVG